MINASLRSSCNLLSREKRDNFKFVTRFSVDSEELNIF